jgi:cephalosporin hydroxylase
MIENMSDDSIFEVYRRAVEHFPDGSLFAEVGVYYGNSVLWLAKEIEKSGKDIHVFAVDRFDHKDIEGAEQSVDIFGDFLANIKGYERIIWPLQQDSVIAAQKLNGSFEIDFVYIDADHSFDSVLWDILAWKKIMKKNGWIGGHDYNHEGVFGAVNAVFGYDNVERVKTDSWLVKL